MGHNEGHFPTLGNEGCVTSAQCAEAETALDNAIVAVQLPARGDGSWVDDRGASVDSRHRRVRPWRAGPGGSSDLRIAGE